MDIIFLLIPLALVLVVVIVWVFMWAVRSEPVSYTHLRAHETNDLISDAVFCV